MLQTQENSKAIALATAAREKALLERRLRDRDSELREKTRLLERVQDELVGTEMQVNVAEQEKERLKRENEELVARLVGEREVEVQKMNRQSGWDGAE